MRSTQSATGRRLAPILLSVVVIASTACGGGGSGSKSSSASGAGSGSTVANGTLKIGYDLSGDAGDPVVFDPTLSHVVGDQIAWELPIYDSLLHYNAAGNLVPGLAESATIVNPSTISVQLRPGVVFSDGTPFTASAVKAGILRNKAAPQRGQFSATLQDVGTIDVNSPTSLTINLSQPVSGAFYPLLAGEETFISAPTSTNAKPIGAGPYMLERYSPDQQIVLVKNPKYWNAANIHLGQLDIVNVPGGPQQINAIEAGTVNLESSIPLADVSALKANGSLTVDSVPSPDSMLWMPVCKSDAPLSSLQVRQALSYAIDRNAINQAVLQGSGQPQWALWPQGSVYFPKSLQNVYAYNPAKARQLLSEAGYSKGFNLSIIVIPGVPLASQAVQIIQSEWKQIGVNLTIQQSSNFVPDVYINHKAPLAMVPTVRGGLAKLSGPYQPGSIGNLCGYSNPTLNGIVTQLNTLAPTSPQAIQLWDQAQQIVVSNALSIWVDFIPIVNAWDKHVADANIVTSYLLPIPDYYTLRATSGS